MLEVITQLSLPLSSSGDSERFGVSEQIVMDSWVLMSGALGIELQFPVIFKPLDAKSHEMFLVHDKEEMKKILKASIVLQEFVNHGGVVFKVYVVADYVKCVERRSSLLQNKEYEEYMSLEINDLRRSAMEKVENRDVGRLRAIVELVADNKFGIYLPANLIAKLVFLRENSTLDVLHCFVEAPENTSSKTSSRRTPLDKCLWSSFRGRAVAQFFLCVFLLHSSIFFVCISSSYAI